MNDRIYVSSGSESDDEPLVTRKRVTPISRVMAETKERNLNFLENVEQFREEERLKDIEMQKKKKIDRKPKLKNSPFSPFLEKKEKETKNDSFLASGPFIKDHKTKANHSLPENIEKDQKSRIFHLNSIEKDNLKTVNGSVSPKVDLSGTKLSTIASPPSPINLLKIPIVNPKEAKNKISHISLKNSSCMTLSHTVKSDKKAEDKYLFPSVETELNKECDNQKKETERVKKKRHHHSTQSANSDDGKQKSNCVSVVNKIYDFFGGRFSKIAIIIALHKNCGKVVDAMKSLNDGNVDEDTSILVDINAAKGTSSDKKNYFCN